MITKLKIKGFKRFHEVTFDDLSRINIFIGINNVGKTTALEGLMGLASGSSHYAVLNVAVYNRIPVQGLTAYQLADLMLQAFHDAKSASDLSFTFNGVIDGEEKCFSHTLEPGQLIDSLLVGTQNIVDGSEVMHRQMPVPFPLSPGGSIMMDVPSQYLGKWTIKSDEYSLSHEISYPISFQQLPNKKICKLAIHHNLFTFSNEMSIGQVYSSLKRSKHWSKFIEELNVSFPELKIKNIENIPYPDGTVAPISIQFENGSRHPLYTLGNGFRRWYEVVGQMIAYPNAIHCIDEADATFHYQAQNGFATNLYQCAEKYDNQVFMATHNMEYLKNIIEALEKDSTEIIKNNFRVITLRNYHEDIRVRIIDGEEALRAIQQGLELRI